MSGGSGGRIVVLRALGLGDVLAVVPALRAIRRHYAGHRVLLAAPRALEPVVDLTGAVDELVDAAPLAPLDRSRLGSPDVAVNLHGRGPASTQLLAELDPGSLIAFRHEDAAVDGPTWRADEHEVARWCRLLRHHGITTDERDLHLAPPVDPVPADVRGATVIHPGAASGSRRWPAERWAAVAASERRHGHRVVVTGSAAEVPLATLVAGLAGLDDGDVLAGRTDLGGLAAIVASAGRVLCGDTGVAHLASAFATPSVVLFGPTPPRWWGPPPGPHITIWKGMVGDPHGTEPDPGLAAVLVEEVLAAIERLPRRAAA